MDVAPPGGKAVSSGAISRRRLLRGAAAVLAGATALGAAEGYGLQVERHTLRLPRWDADGFRVVQVSDVHVNHQHQLERAQQAIRMAAAEKPDLLVFTGDFVNVAVPKTLENIVKTFVLLEEVMCPCYGVLGNHDYFENQQDEILSAVRLTPLKMLRNQVVEVDGVSIAGIDDAMFGRHKPDVIEGHRHSKSLLVLFHEPDFVSQVPAHASLQLSGHSHGGEVCLPGGVAIHTPYGAKRYIAGYYPGAHVPLYVSRGVGTLAPFRTFCPPDISVLTLYGA